jgi:hypothetical protein
MCLSVTEVALARHHHRDAGRVGGRDHIGVTHRAARLNHGRNAGANPFL